MESLVIAIRPIDVGIFGSLGALWLGGALFIYVLYRWVIRFERQNADQDPTSLREHVEASRPTASRAAKPKPAAAHGADEPRTHDGRLSAAHA